jgi:hypothetical protein
MISIINGDIRVSTSIKKDIFLGEIDYLVIRFTYTLLDDKKKCLSLTQCRKCFLFVAL